MSSKKYKISEFSKLINMTPTTVRRWDKEGILVAKRTKSGHRYYTDEDIIIALTPNNKNKKVVAFCRTFSDRKNAIDEEINRQRTIIKAFCQKSSLNIDETYIETYIANELERPTQLDLFNHIQLGILEKIIVIAPGIISLSHFDYFNKIALLHQCEILSIHDNSLLNQQHIENEITSELSDLFQLAKNLNIDMDSYKAMISPV